MTGQRIEKPELVARVASTSGASVAASLSGCCRDSTSADAAHARDLRGIRGSIRVGRLLRLG